MQPLPIPINGPAYKNVDEVSLSITSSVLYDGYVDESGSTVKMPGLLQWLNLNTAYGIDGLYLWREKNIAIAVSK